MSWNYNLVMCKYILDANHKKCVFKVLKEIFQTSSIFNCILFLKRDERERESLVLTRPSLRIDSASDHRW